MGSKNKKLQKLRQLLLTKRSKLSIIINIIKKWMPRFNMKRKTVVLFPETQKILSQMGEQIKLARLRRNLSMELVCERANISRATLWSIENGSPSVAIGYYAAVLHALNNMDKDLLLVAKDDVWGRTMQDLKLPVRQRAKKKED